ncbi:diguanylate cyclase [Desulfarculus baarsii DSM 2075]|uniref:diguanylate cyclase n=1 Tax=Desulfarculus baarsii (strain ATCC 33931 / DSM 2075 / LMG 7858 / VKM B-1802 / 2st14) TaxID=644282 RepID=E1QFS7_DESB2|nr:GGDEF domain-containing protein [Desulfarculus baarsii]ADK84537.1 diguanylate cyclase [Desulfarculus baarsii DSM 2075]
MDLHVDIKTLLLAITVVDFFLAAAMIMFWKVRKTYPGFGLCAASALTIAVTYLLFTIRGLGAPPTLGVVLPNVLVVLTSVLRLEGTKLFLGWSSVKRLNLWLWPVLAVAYFCFFTHVQNDILARTAGSNIFMICIALRLTWLMATKPSGQGKGPYYLAALVFLALALMLIIRLSYMFMDRQVAQQQFIMGVFNAIVLIVAVLVELSWAWIFLVMNSQRLEQEITSAQEKLILLAASDPLTGLVNRRRFLEMGQAELERSLRYGRPLAVLVMDVDHFKRVNDSFGHATGDLVLRQTAQACLAVLREPDVLGRLGGDEFAALLPETTLEGALALAERLRQAVGGLRLDYRGQAVRTSLSIGVAAMKPDDTPHGLIERADAALYKAKHQGRDQVQAA